MSKGDRDVKSKLRYVFFAVIAGIFVLAGCSSNNQDSAAQDKLIDRYGQEITRPQKVERIISTAPSNTEILVALGLGDNLVAVDSYSEDIEGINSLAEYLDLVTPDAETVISLQPDLIITSGINSVGNVENSYSIFEDSGIMVVDVPTSESIEDIYADIAFIADLTGTVEEGNRVIQNMQEEISDIAAIGKTIENPKTVYFEIGSAPSLYSFGNGTYLNEMIDIIGAANIFGNEEGWISPSEEAVIEANPDVILTNDAYVKDSVQAIYKRAGWESIIAVQNQAIYKIDTNASARPTHNIVTALKQMAKAVYPDAYSLL